MPCGSARSLPDGSIPLKSTERLAVAVDLGTTTIAASLIDPESGQRLAFAGGLNPQREFGADVVARLAAAEASPDTLKRMADLTSGALQRLAGELLAAAGAPWGHLARLAIAGNPAMIHILLGLPVRSLAFPPYRPLTTGSRRLSTAELGWERAIDTHIFPLPGGFVGGDLVAFLFGMGIGEEGDTSLLAPRAPCLAPRLYLDLGTNGELALVTGDAIYATSAAAGPAFEGGNLACGMAALPGAVSAVALEDDRLVPATIGNAAPAGICGSGVLSTIDLLLHAGVLDHTGRLREPEEIASNLANRVVKRDGENVFVLHRDARRLVYLSQDDIRQVQLAKGAVRAGMEVLCERAGIGLDLLEGVVLTGSFGAVLAAASLKSVGIFTGKMVEIASFVREGALSGVERFLRLPAGSTAVEQLAAAIKVIPLSGTPAFEKHFLEQMNFPRSTES
jgi:uncharacterized 2Fe-2S/4Fe-4S cluster protein (DUF4445 family)